jgi:hypothetical protein
VEPAPIDAHDLLSVRARELLELQALREASVRKLSIVGNVKQFAKTEMTRQAGESVEDFVERFTSLPLDYDQLGPFPISIVRDYAAEIGHVKFGDIDVQSPKYMEWFFKGEVFTELMGVEPGRCQATITKQPSEQLLEPWSGWIRADVFAMRPIHDHLLSELVARAMRTPAHPDSGGRPLFELEKTITGDATADWIATFLHQEPTEVNGQKAFKQLWYRLHWKQLADELVLTRIDELPALGTPDSLPKMVTLLDKYRKVDAVNLPHRVRVFRIGNTSLRGAEFVASETKVNDSVLVPTEQPIPTGTTVRDHLTGKRYRQPAVGSGNR